MTFEPPNNQIIATDSKNYHPLLEAFAVRFTVLFPDLDSAGLGSAEATSSATSLTLVLVALANVFLHSGHAVISSSGDGRVSVLAASAAISARLPDERVRFPRLPPQHSDIFPSCDDC